MHGRLEAALVDGGLEAGEDDAAAVCKRAPPSRRRTSRQTAAKRAAQRHLRLSTRLLDVGMVGNGNRKVGTGFSLGFGSGAAHCLQQPAGSGSGKVRLGGWPAGEGTSTV